MRKPNAKERILEAAGELFHRRGYSEVGINEIISTADTAKASFYQHFPSKEALCCAWLEKVHQDSEDYREQLLAQEIPPVEKVAAYFDRLAEYMQKSNFRGCPYSNTKAVVQENCACLMELIETHKESIRRFFAELARERFGEGPEATRAGNIAFVIYSGATTETQNLGALWPAEAGKQAVTELFREDS